MAAGVWGCDRVDMATALECVRMERQEKKVPGR